MHCGHHELLPDPYVCTMVQRHQNRQLGTFPELILHLTAAQYPGLWLWFRAIQPPTVAAFQQILLHVL